MWPSSLSWPLGLRPSLGSVCRSRQAVEEIPFLMCATYTSWESLASPNMGVVHPDSIYELTFALLAKCSGLQSWLVFNQPDLNDSQANRQVG